MAAAKDLPPSTAFLYVPTDLHINKHTVKARSPDLWNDVYLKHPEIFSKHYDYQYLWLIVYVFHELLKGEESFWHPYFEVISWSDIPMLWTEDELSEFQDAVLKATIIQYRKDFDEEWELCYKTFQNYEKYFPGLSDPSKKDHFQTVFIRAFNSVVTRCFGWGLPCTTMVPFADFINHHNVDSSYEFVSRNVNPTEES